MKPIDTPPIKIDSKYVSAEPCHVRICELPASLNIDEVVKCLNERGVVYGERSPSSEKLIHLNNVSHSMCNFKSDGLGLTADVKLMDVPINKFNADVVIKDASDVNFAMRSFVGINGEHQIVTFDLMS